MGVFKDLYPNKIEDPLLSDRHFESQVIALVSRMASDLFTHALNNADQGYCYKFKIPIANINKLYKLLGIDKNQLFQQFERIWGRETMTNRMHSDPYYMILLLLIYFGLKNKRETLAHNCYLLLLARIWNGRKTKYIPYCDPRVMNYVISNMMNKTFLCAKYESPVSLLRNYFVPVMLKKYRNDIIRDPVKHLKRLFENSFSQIRQIFASRYVTDITTGKRVASSGLLGLYKKAKDENLYIQAMGSVRGDEEDRTVELGTTSERDNLVNDIADYISMNPNPNYPRNVLLTISRGYKTNVSTQLVERILMGLHDYNNSDMVHDIVSIILARTDINHKTDICKPDWINNIKKKVIRSKNTKDIILLKKILTKYLNQILVQTIGKTLDDYSYPHQQQLRNVVIYGVYYNCRTKYCSGQIH
jgi:hypothetical protein